MGEDSGQPSTPEDTSTKWQIIRSKASTIEQLHLQEISIRDGIISEARKEHEQEVATVLMAAMPQQNEDDLFMIQLHKIQAEQGWDTRKASLQPAIEAALGGIPAQKSTLLDELNEQAQTLSISLPRLTMKEIPAIKEFDEAPTQASVEKRYNETCLRFDNRLRSRSEDLPLMREVNSLEHLLNGYWKDGGTSECDSDDDQPESRLDLTSLDLYQRATKLEGNSKSMYQPIADGKKVQKTSSKMTRALPTHPLQVFRTQRRVSRRPEALLTQSFVREVQTLRRRC